MLELHWMKKEDQKDLHMLNFIQMQMPKKD